MDRRLPVYLMIDCSESMVGEPIAAVAAGIDALLAQLRSEPQALETAWLSLIAFAGKATQLYPLTEILQFRRPQFSIGPGTGLGAAIDLLCDCLDREVRRSTRDQKGDWKPIAFLLTDGQPTDDWHSAAAKLHNHPCNLIALGCGVDVDMTVLRSLTPNALILQNATPDAIKAFFQWVSASVTTTSAQVGREGQPVDLPALPGEFAGDVEGRPSAEPSQVILAARCRQNRAPYLMRYRLDPNSLRYTAEGAYPVGEDYFVESGGGTGGGQVSNANLDGVPDCPHCGETGWGMCGVCHGLHCCPMTGGMQTCPHCGKQDIYQAMVFDVSKTIG